MLGPGNTVNKADVIPACPHRARVQRKTDSESLTRACREVWGPDRGEGWGASQAEGEEEVLLAEGAAEATSAEGRGNTSCSRHREVREAGPQSEVSKGRSWGQRGCKKCAGIIPWEQGSPW